ncbi:hypothetical protein Q4489_16035 [Thalassotalea sp. 1_MG-2023]|uniref:hypothetical protein n=1 Tax=Thalassotalea sp. 1_MG-2023 TaxID=3062680 RepID=UPI0026E2C89A|nr:hypothetical protein [Thalassotalea sp. 1_MG-2023]MDO6428522.1 hypothetical protein [Thalassotalea sp. 1_MG-2023]
MKSFVLSVYIQHPVQWYRFLIYDQHLSKLSRINIFTKWLKNELINNPNNTHLS